VAKRPDSKAAGAPEEPLDFERALERLETIVEDLEGGALSLEESLARYEEGIRLSRRLSDSLDAAEQRIERLSESGGEPTTEPLELESRSPDPPGGEGELPF
jgi:exodeoxyribonuclease VII small subunit